jgi:kinesin family protein 3/17
MSGNEREAGYATIVDIDQQSGGVAVTNPAGQKVNFKFDFAYPDGISQEEVYETTAAPIVAGVLEGFNGTIFAYGQTGTGKTYSMEGKLVGEHRGIVPRAFEHIFDYVSANSDSHQFLITVTYVEIYNDELRDLLAAQPGQSLKIREDPQHGVQIKGVAVHKAQKLEDLQMLLNFGKKNRVVRKTNMNAESSRSHSILTLSVETLTQIEGGEHVRSAKLNLVDLAGSERAAKTGAEGVGFTEGVNINYELMILGNCIAALTSKGNTHIPYRDSKLTMLLKDSLGGNARTMMIAALGPASYNFMETMSTLRYAERAKKIENKPKVNMDPKDALLLQYQQELAALQAQLEGGGGGGAGGGAASQQSEEEKIKQMEEVVAAQMKKLASGANMAKAEREKLEQELERKRREIEDEKEKRAQYEARLQELGKYLAGGRDLRKQTEQNEQEIARIRERLKEREQRAVALEKEVEARRVQKQVVVDKCSSIQSQVEAVSRQFTDSVEFYRNLQLKLPEVQRTIQADRENMAQNVAAINKRIELYTLIVENFVPAFEAENLRKTLVYDEERKVWKRPEADKKSLAQKVLSVERPKSATGAVQPQASGKIAGRLKKQAQMPSIQLAPHTVKSRVKPGPTKMKSKSVEEALAAALQDLVNEVEIDVPSFLKGISAEAMEPLLMDL